MFKNYLKVAFRNIFRQKMFSLINILGLAIGVTVFILIMLYVIGELQADSFHKNIDRIYRVERQEKFGITSIPLLDRITEAIPEIETGSRLMPYPGNLKYNNEIIPTRITFIDSTFFRMFNFESAAGDLTTALNDKHAMVITESYAEQLFGEENPIGQTIIFSNAEFTITAVRKDLKMKTQLNMTDLMGNFLKLKDFGEDFENDWWGNYVTYIMLPKGMEPSYLNEKLAAFNAQMKEIVHESYPEHWFNPVKKLYFELGKYDHSRHGNLMTVQMFLAAAILIIVIACINFLNLSTARAMIRAKEIGVRKVVGAHKQNLIMQFLGESVIISLLAGTIALVILEIIYPHFAGFFEMTSELHTLHNYIFFLAGMILIGLISGIYPAFFLASSVPVEVIRGEQTSGTRGATFRKILTVFQFGISIILIAGTLIVQKQLNYIQNRDMGFNKDQILTFRIPSECWEGKRDVFQQEILSISGVKAATYLYTTPGRVILQWGYTDEEGNTHEFRTIPTDPEFINVFEIPMVEGSNWDWERDPQNQGVIVNESFVEMMNWDDPLQELIWGEVPIRGVMKDFIYRTFHFEIEPLLIVMDWEQTYSMSVKLSGKDIQNTIKQIENKYYDFEVENTFDYYFLDEDFARYYRAEIRFGKIFTYFSLLAIFVACLGLFGLASFMTSQRTKEIGIRKVLGSSVSQLIRLLAYDSVKWVLLANVIAWPVCWIIMNNWLKKFAFRTNIDIFILLLAGLMALFIALITVIFHTYRSATSNPVEALKYE